MIAVVLLVAGCGGSNGPTNGDMLEAGDGGGGLAAFGASCTMNGQCASNVCFVGGNRAFCSMHCTPATQAMDCPAPPTSGLCNMQGYCKP